jgi:protease PrsW
MRYFYQGEGGVEAGPYTREELRQLHLSGVIKPDTVIRLEDTGKAIPFQELWAQWQSDAPGKAGSIKGSGDDLRPLVSHLLVPFGETRDFKWLKSRRLLAIAAVGLVPLVVQAATPDLRAAFWGMAFYFSALWALFFYHVFPTPEARLSTCVLCFFTTGVLSISVLLLAYLIPPLSWLVQGLASPSQFKQMFAFIFGVGLPEELCKALALFVLLRKSDPLSPQVMLFYGLMSGLGFGIYEGVDYQLGRNFRYASSGGEYYLLNVVRLTTLPFLHAMWTGIAGYFIGFAGLYPRRRRELIMIGIGLPMVLHGLYNTFNQSILGLGFALLTVLALNLYLARSVEFEEALIEKNLSEMP